jgi:predicted dithiol-disulfide oxidoreductase (DUF899 family)
LTEQHRVVSHDEWIEARTSLLIKEKEFTRLRDELSRRRRDLVWEAVDKEYVFEGPLGKETLAEVFDGRSQLIVYHFMFGPEDDAGCPSCSFWADNFNGIPVHLRGRDVSFVAISRAPYGELAAYRKRMGWTFKWLSSFETDFNFDYYASFTPDELTSGEAFSNYARVGGQSDATETVGVSVFYRDESGEVFHTYSTYSRGVDMVNGAYHYLDMLPKGRDEAGHDNPQFWVRRHDEY